MISHINIENVLSHKSTDIELHEGVNVFVGESDAGKSSIIRWGIGRR
jgi:DNA repair ATPase RecN